MPKKVKKKEMNLDEVYRQLRTNIEFSQVDDRIKLLNIISTLPKEGKTSVAINLAKIFSEKYPKVLLVDCDFRNPSVHKRLRLANSSGLTDLLLHYQPGNPVIYSDEIQFVNTRKTNPLHVLTAGKKSANPSVLVNSNRFKEFLKQAKQDYDFVIVDCPPAMAVSDGVPISFQCDGTLFVVSAKDTDKNRAREVVDDLKRNGANLIGTVLTKVPDFTEKRYAYYGYGYGENKD